MIFDILIFKPLTKIIFYHINLWSKFHKLTRIINNLITLMNYYKIILKGFL